MNIGFVATFPNPNDPDVSKAGYRHVTQLIKLLSENNKVTLYSVSNHKWTVNLSFCNIIYIRSSNLVIRWLKLFQKIVKERKKLDLLIVYNPTISTCPAIPLKMLYSFPIVVDYVDKQGIQGQSKIMRLIDLVTERIFLLTMDNWLTDSKHLEREVKRANKRANIMLYRGVLSERSYSDMELQSFPLKVEDNNNINIAYSGSLHHYHGVDVLIDAFSKLPPEDVYLYITGFGPMKPLLKGMVKKKKISNVSFIHLDNNMIHNFLSKMDILVIPHKNTEFYTTGFPSKIIEYMWAGKAIIATTVGEDVLDIFENGETAILIEPENEEALRKALADMITDERKRKELGINARRYFEDNFSEKVVKSKITKYLLNCCKMQTSAK